MSFIITVQGYVGLESLPTAQFPVREGTGCMVNIIKSGQVYIYSDLLNGKQPLHQSNLCRCWCSSKKVRAQTCIHVSGTNKTSLDFVHLLSRELDL